MGHLNNIIIAIVMLLGIGLSLWGYLGNKKSRTNQLFLLLVLFPLLNVFFTYVARFDPGLSVFLSRLAWLSGSLAILSLYFFIIYFPRKTKSYPYLNIIVLVVWSIFSVLSVFTKTIVESTSVESWGVQIISGPAMPVFYTSFVIFLFICSYILYKKYRFLNNAEKLRIRYFIAGLIIFISFSVIFSIILPAVFKNEKLTFLGDYSILIFFGMTAYSIVKHQLMDIRTVVARSVSYAMLLLILAGFYAGVIFLAQSFIFPEANASSGYVVLQIILALIMAFSFQPLRRWITKATDKIFFKNQYDPEVLLDTLAHTIGSTIVLIELLYKALDIVLKEMKITRGIAVVLTDAGKIYTHHYAGYKEEPKLNEDEILKMAKDGVLVYDELEENSRFKHMLGKYQASIAIPIKTENDTEGLLMLGEKLSGDMYSQTDMQVLEILAPEMAVAITNAKSFEKIEKFNITLRQEVKKATGELEHKNEQLRELDKAKDEFISMASHQLRTPLTAIKGYLSMLLEGDAGEIKVSQYDFVNEAFSGANRMVGLINDLLNVSRMETGRFFLEPVEVDLNKLIGEEVKQLANHAKEKHLALKFNCVGSVPKIWADETKIRQVVMNFIDNAIYYTSQGSVTVTLKKEGGDVVFTVDDTGIGVPKAAQKQLFQKFYRADNARHVRPDGTGLGIYLAKKVVDDHHGKLIFKSTEGKGSTFGFRFPIKSKLSTKRLAAPAPSAGTTPAVGELAAGIGVSAEALAATTLKKPEEKLASTDSAHSTSSGQASSPQGTAEKAPEEKSATESANELIKEAELAHDK